MRATLPPSRFRLHSNVVAKTFLAKLSSKKYLHMLAFALLGQFYEKKILLCLLEQMLHLPVSAMDPTSPQVDRHVISHRSNITAGGSAVISEIFESMTRFPDIWRSLETIGRLSGRDVLVRCASNLWSEYRFANNTHTYKHDKMVSYKSDCVKAVALVQQAECVYVFLKRTPGIRNWNPQMLVALHPDW